MIKRRLLSLVSLICLLLCAGSALAQVSVQVQSRQNPLPAQGGIYMTDPGRFFNIVLTNNSASEFLPVRLEVRLEGPIENGVDIWPNGDSFLAVMASRTMPTYIPLQPGQTRVLTQTDLMNMFRQYDGGTEMYGGGQLYEVFTGGANDGAFGLLPEGHYGMKITAKTNFTEYNDPGEVLGEGYCYFDICYNAKAPSFNNIEYLNNNNTYESGFVEQGGYYTAYFPTSNPRFSWTEPTFNATGLSVKRQFLYDFRIYQLANNQEPSDATLHNGVIAFEQCGLMTPQCFVPYNVVAELKRYRNVKYVAQVTARTLVSDASNPNYTIIENGGKSEMILLLMEDSGIGGGEDSDIIVDTSNRDYPINVTINTKRTELPYAMYGYFETPGELFDITLENTSSETIPVCMLLQYYKGNWGVTAAPNRQHTDRFIEIPAGEKITLSEEQINELAGDYDIDYDVIAFKAKTGFIIGKPTSEYFTEKTDTAFLRVCRYTGGKAVLRETIIGKGRTPFTVNPDVISGEMFNVTFEPKHPIMPADGKYYFTKPSRLFKVKIKNLAHNDVRLFPFIHYFENPTQEDEVAYVGDCFTPERLDLPPLAIESGKERSLTDEEVDMYFGGFDQVHKIDAMWQVDNIMDPSEVVFDPSFINQARLFLMDYDKLLSLDLETEKKSSAILMNYDIQYNVSHDVKLGDVDILIEPVVGFPTNGDVYINDPGRVFKITLTNLTDEDMELIPGITYEGREIDDVTYSYTASKWFTKPSFILPASETMVLDRAFLKQYCGDETAVRFNHSTGEKEEAFTDFDEIITTEDANKMKFILVDAISLNTFEVYEDMLSQETLDQRSELITVATQACEFWADPNIKLYDLNVYLEFKKSSMPCNPRAYLTKPEQLFKVWLENTSDEPIQMIPFITFNFNGDMDTTYLCGSYRDENIPTITVEPGPKKQMNDEYVHMLFSGNNFFKVFEKEDGTQERVDYNIFNIDRDVTLDPELFSRVQLLALNPDFLEATGTTLDKFIVGSGKLDFQVSPTERLDDIGVTVKPKSDPLPSNAELYFNSPGVLFDVELKNNTLETYNVIPNIMYLFDDFGSYYGSVYDDDRLDQFVTIPPGETKLLTSEMLNKMCGTPKEVKCFEARVNGYDEKPIEDINTIVNLEAFNQIEVIAYCADSLKKLPKDMEDRKSRAMLGGGKSDFNAKNIAFEDVVVTIAPKGGADYRLEPDDYFEKPGDLFKVTLRNLTTEEKKVNLRLTFNDKYFIDKPDSLITLGSEDKLELTAEQLNNICGYDIYSYGAPLFECDENGVILSEKPAASELEMKKGDNKVTALVWRKKIADEEKPNVYSVDSVSVCDTIFQPALRKLWIGDYRLTLTEFEKIDGKDAKMKEEGNDCFKGKGYVSDTIMGMPVRIAVEYDSIYVNNELQRVVKNNVRSILEESSHAPIDIFKEEIVKQLGESDKETAEAKVDELLDKSGMGAFYTYVIGNAMQTIGKVDSLSMVKLPLGLTVPMDKDMKCPATIQLAQKEYTPVDANIDLLGEFVMPESEYLDSEILIFAARKLTSSPDEFLPKTGSLGLVKDFTVNDPNSAYKFTFKAPTNQDYSKATDGCYIMWKDGDFAELCASISMNLPYDELMKDDGTNPVEKGVHPNITLTAFIADKEDWYATVKMDDFQSTRAPGFTFSVTGAETGIVLDRSKKKTPEDIKFPENYKFDDPLGLSADPGKDETAYNEWQGFYFEKLGCKLPPFVELDDAGKTRAEISVNNMIYDDSGFSMNVSVDSLLNKGTAKMGGWNITIDKIWLNIKQSDFGDAGINGRIEVPLLYAKTSDDKKDDKGDDEGGEKKDGDSGEKKKAQIGYKAKIANAVKDDKEGIEIDFSMQQIEDEIAFDFMLAEVSFNKEKTYFNVKYSDLYPEDKRTRVELRLDGEVAIKCSENIDFELPTIPFEDMRFANFKDEEEKTDKSPDSKQQASTEGQSLTSPDGDVDFHTGRWALSGDPDDGGEFWGGFPLVLDGISMKVGDGAKSLGVYVNGGIVVMGNAKTGLGATVGLTIWSDVDWDKMDISYRNVEFNDMHVEGSFGGMVSISGDLTVKDELKGGNEEKNSEGGEQKQEEGGEDSDAGKMKGFDAKLTIKVKGLFDASISGGYYKVKKGSADYELDDADEKKNEYYHAGYFLADAEIAPVPIGPVSLKGITGGIFINYAVAVSELEEADDFVQAMHDNLKPKYKSYGGAFGVKLVVGEETLVKGDAVMLLMIDMQSDGTVRCPGFMFQGKVAALCAPDSDEGLINSKITILYEDTTTPELTAEEKKTKTADEIAADAEKRKEEHKLFRLSITMDADIAGMYKNITGEEYQVANPMVGLEEFDQKKADAENQGDQNNSSSSAGSAESKGYIKAGASASMSLELEIRNYPSLGKSFWHLYVGEPDESKRCRITFIDFEFGRTEPVGLWAKLYANAYLCIGNELPGNGQLPALPEKVVEALGMEGADGKVDNSLKGKIEAARQQTMKGGPAGDINGGIMMGAAIGAEIGCNAVFCYANVEGMLGFDLILKQYAKGVPCKDGGRAGGKNGFYATGQFYAMLKGELGLMIDLWIFEGKVPLVDMTLGALLQGGFPNPTYVYGRLRAKGSVLGGLIKFNSTIEMKAGKVCIPDMGNPLDDIKVFGDIQPGDEDIEMGWSEKNLASCYGKSTFTTNMKIGEVLTLVDENETMDRAGMGDEVNNVLRKYVFYIDDNFEMAVYDDSDATNDDRNTKRAPISVTHINPTYDHENYQIVTGSLEPNTLYRIKLRGTCKEIVNGDYIDPIYEKDGKKESRPYEDVRYVYFRTGGLSEDINEEVMGFVPNQGFTCTLDNVVQPSFMEEHQRSDYWSNPDYEFLASVKVRDEETGLFVLPDAPQGLRKGQTSQFENLRVVEVVEQGVDEDGNEFKYATVMLEKPLPEKYFEKDRTYRFEIQRINSAQVDAYISMIEENYKSIMAMTEEDMANYESELAAMDAAIAEGDSKAGDETVNQAIRDLYNYYKEVEAKYGDNEAEQRMKEYKEQLKQNSSGFSEVVYTHDYTYNGYKSFTDYVKNVTWGDSYKDLDVPIRHERTFPVGVVYKVNDIKMTGTETMKNNPYYRLNFWHSTATLTRAPKYDFCELPFDQCQGEYGTGITFTASYPEHRKHNTNNGATMSDRKYEESYNPKYSGRWIRLAYEGTGNLNTHLHKQVWNPLSDDAWMVEKFEEVLVAASTPLKKLHDGVKDYQKGKDYYPDFTAYATSASSVQSFITESHTLNSVYYPRMIKVYPIYDNKPGSPGGELSGIISMPHWQLGLIYAADYPGTYGLTAANCSRGATANKIASNILIGKEPRFMANNFLSRVDDIEVTLRYNDAYNIAAVSSNSNGNLSLYGVRPSTSAQRSAILKWKGGEAGDNGTVNINIAENEYVHIADPAMRSLLLAYYDKSPKDGKLHVDEMNAITELSINYSKTYTTFDGKKVHITSLDALRNMPNLERLKIYDVEKGEGTAESINKFEKMNKTLSFNGNPKLKRLELVHWYALDTLDLRPNQELEELYYDCRPYDSTTEDGFVKIDGYAEPILRNGRLSNVLINNCKKLRHLKIVNGTLTGESQSINLKNMPQLESLDLRYNRISDVYIRESYQLDDLSKVKLGWQRVEDKDISYKKNVDGLYTHNYIKNRVRSFISAKNGTNVINYNSDNYKVELRSVDDAANFGAEDLDSVLLNHLLKKAECEVEKLREWTVKQTTLDISGLGVNSVKNLWNWMPALVELNASDNNLKELDVAAFAKLEKLNASNNSIRTFNVRPENSIKELVLNNNELQALPLDWLTKLTRLECNRNAIEVMYLNSMPGLLVLDCSANRLTELYMDKLVNLTTLKCSNNAFEEGKLVLPVGVNMKVFEAENALTGMSEINLSAMNRLERLNLSNNENLRDVYVSSTPTTLQYIDLHGCENLRKLWQGYRSGTTGFNLVGSDKAPNYGCHLPALREIDLSGCKILMINEITYDETDYPELRKINVTDCRVIAVNLKSALKDAAQQTEKVMTEDEALAALRTQLEIVPAVSNEEIIKLLTYVDITSLSQSRKQTDVALMNKIAARGITGADVLEAKEAAESSRTINTAARNGRVSTRTVASSATKLTSLCVGAPNRMAGQRVPVTVYDKKWFTRWDEWKDWPENKHTTYMVYYDEANNETVEYDESLEKEIEEITKDDAAMRAAMGENLYGHLKEKLSPDSRALHVKDVEDFTELNCAYMDIVDLNGIIKYMPDLKVVNAEANELKSIDLKDMPVLDSLNLSYNPVLETLDLAKAAKWLNISNSFVDDAAFDEAVTSAAHSTLIADNLTGPVEISISATPAGSPSYISMKNSGKQLTILNCHSDELVFGGKSLKFNSDKVRFDSRSCYVGKIVLDSKDEPVELIFTTADMALMWINKWVDDNKGAKFTMTVNTGNSEVDTKFNNQLNLVNSVTMNGGVNITSEMKTVANNLILGYVWDGAIPEGVRLDEVLDMFDLHEKRSEDDERMHNAMGTKLHDSLREKLGVKTEYVHTTDVAKLQTLDCANMGVTDLGIVMDYLPVVTTVNAAGNSFGTLDIKKSGQLSLLDISDNSKLRNFSTKMKAVQMKLNNSYINQAIFDAATANAGTLEIDGNGGTQSLTLNVTPAQGSSSFGKVQTVQLSKLKMRNTNRYLDITKCSLDLLEFGGARLKFPANLSSVSIRNLELERSSVMELQFGSADVALKWMLDWWDVAKGQKLKITFYNVKAGYESFVKTNFYDGVNDALAAGITDDRYIPSYCKSIVALALNGAIPKGDGYAEMENRLNTLGIIDVLTEEDKKLHAALGTALTENLRKQLVPDRKYLHVGNVAELTTLDASGYTFVDPTTTLGFMPKLKTLITEYHEFESLNISNHPVVMDKLVIDSNPYFTTLTAKSNRVKEIHLSYSNINNTILTNALNVCSGTVYVYGNYGPQLLTLNTTYNASLTMQNTNRILKLTKCNFNTLKFGGSRLWFAGDLAACKVNNLILQRTGSTSSGVIEVNFATADVALSVIQKIATGKTGTGVKVKIVFSTGSATKDKALNESSQVKAINALLVNGKTVPTSLLNEVNGYLHNAVKNKILPAGSTYVAPASTSSSGSFGRVL